jgi:hypothetical protein
MVWDNFWEHFNKQPSTKHIVLIEQKLRETTSLMQHECHTGRKQTSKNKVHIDEVPNKSFQSKKKSQCCNTKGLKMKRTSVKQIVH